MKYFSVDSSSTRILEIVVVDKSSLLIRSDQDKHSDLKLFELGLVRTSDGPIEISTNSKSVKDSEKFGTIVGASKINRVERRTDEF